MKPASPSMLVQAYITCICLLLLACTASKPEEDPASAQTSSPDQALLLTFLLNEQQAPVYSITYQGKPVITEAKLGILREDADFTKGFTLQAASAPKAIKDSYELLHGKRKNSTYEATERTYTLKNKEGQTLEIVFRLSNDGAAFRYRFPESDGTLKKIKEEVTSFRFPAGSKAFLQPMSEAKTGWSNTNPSYEEHYLQNIPTGQPSPTPAGWVYPALFDVQGTWVLITEADLDRNYCATRLQQASAGNEYQIGFPQEQEVMGGGALKPQSTLPWQTPWRVLTIGSLGTLVESTLGTDLAAPAIKQDFSFVKPGVASWSWALLKDDSVVYPVQKRFVDFAARMNWEYCLVDVNWDSTIGYERIAELARYAETKGVGLMLWYNSAGDWNTAPYTPKNKLLTHESRVKEFSRLKEMGIKGVKIDFFGGDGQSVIQYYHDVFTDAAAHGILVNCHGSTLPRGWHRTYPNLLTMEAIKGFEFITFDQGNANLAPNHCAMLPFTRNAFDPMDFTPLNLSQIPGIERKTTVGFELALPYLFLSGIQHIAETPRGMAGAPQYVQDFLKEIPVAWDDTRFLDGYPGKLAVIARKKGDAWYIMGINGEENAKTLNLDLSFIGAGKKGILITDGESKNSFSQQEVNVSDKAYAVSMKGNGGFVMKF